MLLVAVLLVMLACGYSQYRNGLFSSCAMLIMVFLAGVTAFGFFEPIADILEPYFQGSALSGAEDMLALTALFAVTLFALRFLSNFLNPEMIEHQGALQHFGAAGVGLITGYFVAGFLLCAVQTLPLDERFMGFEPRSPGEPAHRMLYPGDRVWLAMMRHAGASPLAWQDEQSPTSDASVDRYFTFDRNATFELRYTRYRRANQPYFGDFDREVRKR
jgi:uncharacterized membrane protein required for colicin V production